MGEHELPMTDKKMVCEKAIFSVTKDLKTWHNQIKYDIKFLDIVQIQSQKEEYFNFVLNYHFYKLV